VSAAAEKLRASSGREPEHEEIAREVGMTVEEVHSNLSKLTSAQLLSLDQPLGESGVAGDEYELTLESVVKDSGESPSEIVEKRSKLEALAEAIPRLSENQQRVVYLYYNEELTLKEVAKVLDLTEGRVCQIHKEAIEKLRAKMARWNTE
jgi:RNA polymerase sigma factor for flagellar operon FliA